MSRMKTLVALSGLAFAGSVLALPLMAQTIVPTRNELEVRFGDTIDIAFAFRHRSPLADAVFEIRG